MCEPTTILAITSAVLLDIENTFGRANQDAAVIERQSAFEDRASAVNYSSGLAGVERPTIVDAGLAVAGGYAKAATWETSCRSGVANS